MRFLFLVFVSLCLPALASKPNVLFIAIDDLRPELGCYGSDQVKSPHIDKLAKQSLLFQRAYCQIAVCGASRASLMTGVWPTTERFVSYKCSVSKDAPGAALLPEVFKQAGYTTIANGKVFHHVKDSAERSWSERPRKYDISPTKPLDPKTKEKGEKGNKGFIYEAADVADDAYVDGEIAQKTIADLKRLKEEGKPFFLACGFIKPHLPFYAPKRYWDLYDREQIQIADNRERPKNAPKSLKGSHEYTQQYSLGDYDKESDEFHRSMRHGYLACVSYIDKLVGDVLAELEAQGLADNTIVVIWGDHGFNLGEHSFWGKHNTMHLATRVPLIIRGPGVEAGATDAIVETSDLFPTLCEMTGLDIPETVQGKSFSSILEDPSKDFREAAFSRYYGARAVITEGFSYTRFSPNEDMLYDLGEDPHENVNVVDEEALAETVERMRKLLDEREAAAEAWKP